MKAFYPVFGYIENYLTSNPIKASVAIAVIAVTAFAYHPSLTDSTYASSIVKVLNIAETGGGTGWAARTSRGKSVIVTNDHVCAVEHSGLVTLETTNGGKYLRRVLKRNSLRDLCLVEGIRAPTLSLASESPKLYDTVRVMGHPLLKPTAPSVGKYTKDGIVTIGFNTDEKGSCKDGAEKVESLFGAFCLQQMELSYTTVPIYPGNSGSPVVNEEGEVIGVMNSADTITNQGMFIPLPYVKEMLDE